MKPEYVPYTGPHGTNDVHRKWIDLGWFRVRLDDSLDRYAKTKATKQRRRDEDKDRQTRTHAAAQARRRALGVQSLALVR